MRRLGLAAGLAVVAIAVLLVVGFSQLTAQAPVPGLRTTLVRGAGLDLLLRAGVPLGAAPSCTTGPTTVVCDGTRADGAPIRLEGPAAGDDPVVTVTVDGRVLVTAPAQQVVDDAGSAP